MTHEYEKPSDDQLAAIFKEFGKTVAQESQLPQDTRMQLIDRIVEAAENMVVAETPKTGWYAIKSWRMVVMASSVVILMLAFVLWRPSPDGNSRVVQIPVQSFAEKHRDLMQVALEYEAIMERPLAWFAEYGNDVQFALLPGGVADHSSRVVFAELTIEKLHTNTKASPTSETCFFMIRDNQPLELFSRDGSTLKMLFWLYPVEDNLFAYELAVDKNNGMKISENTTGLIRSDDVEQPFDVQDNGAEYRVFLQVHPT